MTEPVDLFSALQDAAVLALQPAATTAPVYSNVPENTQPPYFVVADFDSTSEAPKGQGQFERITVEVHSVYRGSSRAKLLAMMHQVRITLDQAALSAEGALFEALQFQTASASRAGPDGVTYVGITVFETYGQPA